MSIATTLARGLGFFSLGLGLYQLLAPRQFNARIGVDAPESATQPTRLVGLRELGAAGGLLMTDKPLWAWARFAGDVMDAGLLARAMSDRHAHRDRLGLALAAVAGIAAVDALAGMALASEAPPRGSSTTQGGVRVVRRAVTVQASPEEAYALWRDFDRFPEFMQHVESVTSYGNGRTHWRVKGPLGSVVEWDAEITDDRPGEVIGWRSISGDIDNAGRVRFVKAPGDRGTEVHVEMEYAAPLEAIGTVVAQILGEEPERQTADDLRRFKQLIETGRVPTSEATIGDRKLRQRPAQPPAADVARSMNRPTAAAAAA
jgi:uncharacterized membrane protein